MNGQLQKVAEMIKKTFHTKNQKDCFDGGVLYIEEHCATVRVDCMKGLEEKFEKINKNLNTIKQKVIDIERVVGRNGNA